MKTGGDTKFKIFFLPTFKKESNKILTKIEIEYLLDYLPKLEKVGNLIGKPLGPNYLREFKFSSERVYFLVYIDIMIILFVASGKKTSKKSQQKLIDKIRMRLPEFKKYAYELRRQSKY